MFPKKSFHPKAVYNFGRNPIRMGLKIRCIYAAREDANLCLTFIIIFISTNMKIIILTTCDE